jgi:hypothetical protein
MIVKKAVKAAALILSFFFLSVLSACGELSTSLFSSGGSYQVKALVNGSSLESCSIIRKNDKIIPYFAISVANDPDLMGLLVYLQNSKGDIIGERVLYTIDPVEEATQPETPQEETEPEETTEEEKTETETEDVASVEEVEGETNEQAEPESPEPVMEKRTFIDSKPSTKKYDTVIQIKSFEQELPHFPLPKNLELGPYSLVFEAVGRYNTLSITESEIFYLGSVEFRLKDISMCLPCISDTHLIPPGTTVMLEASLDFDSRLNPYVIWYNGRNIISEGNISDGAGNILWKAPEQQGFYSLRLEVLPYHLKRNFTGIFREITLPVSTKASHTYYFFGNGPDYPAKRPLSAGTAYAEQVKLALAAAPEENADKTTTALVLPEYPELLRWYRFEGSLDEKSLIPERMFETASEKAPRWASVGQSYGLSAGPDDNYFLRPISFFRQGQDQGGGIFLFHIRPAAEGAVLSAFFPLLASASDGVWMDMTTQGNVITLRLKTKGTSVEIPVNTGYSEEQKFIPIVVEFYIRPYRFEAKLSLGEDLSMQSTGEIRLPGALTGEGRIKLGVDKTAQGETKNVLALPNLTAAETDIPTETVQPESINNENETAPVVSVVTTAVTTVTAVTTIWDEFAVLYSTIPLLPEEIFIEEALETEDAQNEETTLIQIKTPTTETTETRKESSADLSPAEKEDAKTNSAASRPANVNPADTGAPLENEAPLADIQTESTLTEQDPADETRQGSDRRSAGSLPEPAETEDEEDQFLISLP